MLLGWALDLETLKRILRGLTAMNPTTAIAVVLAIICLLTLVAAVASGKTANNGKIAFASDGAFDGAVAKHREEIYVMDANGANQTRLTNNVGWDLDPAWSPDGKKIAFDTERDGNREIYVMDADGSNQTNLTNNPADDFDPT